MIRHSLIIFDVDGTIVDHNNELIPGVREKIMDLFANNDLWCWSHGGEKYANTVLEKHGLNPFFEKVLDKPFYYVDDLESCGMERVK